MVRHAAAVRLEAWHHAKTKRKEQSGSIRVSAGPRSRSTMCNEPWDAANLMERHNGLSAALRSPESICWHGA